MPSLRGILRAVAAVAVLVLGAVTSRAAVDPVGPPIGNNRYRSTISSDTDVDEFIGRFFAGDILSFSLTADRPDKNTLPTLKPVVVLVDPNGLERFAGIVPSADGFGQKLTNMVIDTPGFWGVRVSGDKGTTGSFTIAFRVKPLPTLKFKHLRLGDELPFARTHEFSGFDGAVLNVSIKYTRLSADIDIRSLQDPSGNEVLLPDGTEAFTTATRKRNRIDLKGVVLSKGSGTYSLRVRIPTAAATYNMTLSLVGPPRPLGKSKKVSELSVNEPLLDARSTPHAGDPGQIVQFTGSNFSVSPPPTVLFGTIPSPSVKTSPDGTTLDCVIPPRGPVKVVAVYVINPDGQGAARDIYFAYVPAPEVGDLLDATTGLPVRSSSALGGRQVRLTGAHFDPAQTITLGPLTIAKPVFVGEEEFDFTLPAIAPGTYSITVTDQFTRFSTTEFSVFFKTPPQFGATPYSPSAVKLGAPTNVTLTGTGFEAEDQLVFDGANLDSTFISSTQRMFTVPARGIGSYTVQLIDSIGTVVNGPLLFVKQPPAITAVTISAGDTLPGNVIPILGGSTVQVDGTDFLTDDAVTLGSTPITNFTVNTATRKSFVAPAGSPGFASITIMDGAGQSTSQSNAVRYAGQVDTSASRIPAKSSTDDLSAIAAATADLDRDGLADDVVLCSPLGNSPGSRKQLTRILLGNASGTLVDVTTANFPAANTDKAKIDGWDATCVAIGDIDNANGNDIVIGGNVAKYGANLQQVRLFRQGTTAGTFALDATNAPPSRYAAGLYAYTSYGCSYPYPNYYTRYKLIGPEVQQGTPQAIAIGDIDADSVPDIIVGTDHFQSKQLYFDPSGFYIFTNKYNGSTAPCIKKLVKLNRTDYSTATRVYQNKIPSALKTIDVTTSKLPLAGDSTNKAGQPPALHCRDLALVDLDLDGTLDLVIAWDDPSTVTAEARGAKEKGGTPVSPVATATRVLLYGPKGTTGKFTDSTAAWMPAPSAPEYWQAKKIAFADLDGDGDKDMVLLLNVGLDKYTGTETHTRRALRVLRNDKTKFTDVTGTALPAVVASTGDDFRGDALAIRDVDGDGILDILVSTKDPLKKLDDTPLPRMRVFFGKGAIRYGLQYGFSESVATDTGEADSLLFVGDLAGAGKPVLLLTTETAPGVSPGSQFSRTQEWKK